MSRRQRLAFEGIRYCVEMACFAFARLEESLALIAPQKAETNVNDAFVSSFSYAWLFVDSVNRLCGLLSLVPGGSQQESFQEFVKCARPAKEVRDSIQHLKGVIDRVAGSGYSIWGSIGWVSDSDTPGSQVAAQLIAAGSVPRGMSARASVRFFGRPDTKGDSVFLEVHGEFVHFAKILRSMGPMVRKIEEIVQGIGPCPKVPVENIQLTFDAKEDPRVKLGDAVFEVTIPVPDDTDVEEKPG